MTRQDGLSLVELLVVIAVIGVTFLAMASSQFLGFRVTRGAEQTAVAKDIVSGKIEEIRGYGYFSYKGCSQSPVKEPTLPSAPRCSGKVSDSNDPDLLGNAGYTLSWTIDSAPSNPRKGGANLDQFLTQTPARPPLISVEVTASWGDDAYSLVSYFSCADAGEFSFTDVPCPDATMEPTGSSGGN